MNRRGFIGSILAACAAPAIVRADSLMRIVPLDTTVWTATAKGSGGIVLTSSHLGDRVVVRYWIPFRDPNSPLIAGVTPDWWSRMRCEDITMTANEYLQRYGGE